MTDTDPQKEAVDETAESPPAGESKTGDEETKLTFNPLMVAVEKFTKEGKPLDIQDLFKKFMGLETEERIQCVNAYLLAKCIAEKTGATITIEFLKELGRNERALLGLEKGGGYDGDSPW